MDEIELQRRIDEAKEAGYREACAMYEEELSAVKKRLGQLSARVEKFEDVAADRKFKVRMQNLNDRPVEGHPFWHGRAWIKTGVGLLKEIQVEWSHGAKTSPALSVSFDRDDNLAKFHIAGIGFSYWVSTPSLPKSFFEMLPFKHRRGERYSFEGSNRSIGFRVFDKALWVDLWNDEHEGRHDDPWWYHGRLGVDDLLDFMFSKEVSEERIIEERDVLIPMPEKAYEGKARKILHIFTRSRWPFERTMMRVEVDVPNGIGHPGKGENSWDCAPDATYGISIPNCRTIEDGVGQLVASVLRSRKRYGGSYTATGGAVTS